MWIVMVGPPGNVLARDHQHTAVRPIMAKPSTCPVMSAAVSLALASHDADLDPPRRHFGVFLLEEFGDTMPNY
jgi:hypothetical protein